MDPQKSAATSDRQYYIDWIRVGAFFILIFFHCAMPFVGFYHWEVRNGESSIWLDRLVIWLHQWRLPLLFFISGTGIYFSLRKRSVLRFAGERVVRLFIPLLFAMFFTIPLQVYYEKLQKGLISGSYWKFYPTVWDIVPYPEGTLSWSHMWYVVYLFVFCILLLPVFGLFKIKILKQAKDRISLFLSRPYILPFLFIPLMLEFFALYIDYPEQASLLDDWMLFIFSLTLLLYGYFMGSTRRFWDTCEEYRHLYLGIAAVCVVALFFGYWWTIDFPKHQDQRLYMYGFLDGLNIWMFILAICGYAKKYLNFTSDFLQRANKAVYPFYIIHQTIIVAVGYYLVQLDYPIIIKLIFLVLISFTLIYAVYHFIIKQFVITRFLFGMKKEKREKERVEDTMVVEAMV
jgi:glucans biosynthesis protein C